MLKYIAPGLLAYLKMALYQISYLILISWSLTLVAQRLTLLLLYNVLLLLILYLLSLAVIYQTANLIIIYWILQFLIQYLTLINQSFQVARFNTNKTYKQGQRFLLYGRYLSLSNQLVLLYAVPQGQKILISLFNDKIGKTLYRYLTQLYKRNKQ